MKYVILMGVFLLSTLSFAEVDLEKAKSDWEGYQTEQKVKTGVLATTTLISSGLINDKVIGLKKIKGSKQFKQKAYKIRQSQKQTAKIEATRRSIGVSASRPVTHQGNLSKAEKKIARLKGASYVATTYLGYSFLSSLYANYKLDQKISDLEEDCCTRTDVEGDPSDAVEDSLTDVAETIIYFGNKPDNK